MIRAFIKEIFAKRYWHFNVIYLFLQLSTSIAFKDKHSLNNYEIFLILYIKMSQCKGGKDTYLTSKGAPGQSNKVKTYFSSVGSPCSNVWVLLDGVHSFIFIVVYILLLINPFMKLKIWKYFSLWVFCMTKPLHTMATRDKNKNGQIDHVY